MNRLKEIREKRNKTQTEIAIILNTSQKQIWLYETGQRELKETQIKILCQELQISADKLLDIE